MLPDLIEGYEVVFTHALTGMALLSKEGQILKVNDALCDLWGYRQHELLSQIPFGEEWSPMLDSILTAAKTMHAQEDFCELTCTYLHPSGKTMHLYMKVTFARLPIHAATCYLVQFQDVSQLLRLETKLKHKESQLYESDDVLNTLLADLPLAVIITKQGVIQDVNPAALEMIHAKSKLELIGKATQDIVDNNYHDEIMKRRARHAQGKPLGIVTYLIHCMDETQKFVNGFTIMITYKGDRAAVSIFKDITKERIEEERLMQSEKLNTAGQLAAGIAHEIRNPLTSINGFLKLMRSNQRNKEMYFDIIESELKRIELIVGELLVLAKPQSSVRSRPLDIVPLIFQIVTLMKVQSAFKNIELEMITSSESVWIQGEANQIKQVFINLLKNGIEAMTNNGRIWIRIESSPYEVLIQVQDQGSGMTTEQLQSLGQPFYTTKETGTGLGYMITQNIVHNHNGSIHVESTPGEGTTFTVKLPLLQLED
ncbi:ATP-binding protein [Paenibacillus aquistagni]|uniref:ATP-binding protein n=1 Tax=Paenibacillus aquistagni TaxID=1852522 RepID=UPI00145AC1FA|nr:PAS domain S-box protein [Paenibacillus aquistagni]